MQSVTSANCMGLCILIAILVGLAVGKQKDRSIKVFAGVVICGIICCASEIAFLSGMEWGLPRNLVWLFGLIDYSFGTVSLVLFTHFCYIYIREKTEISRLLYTIPKVILVATWVYILIMIISGNVFAITEEGASEFFGIPALASGIQVGVIVYLPILSIMKHREIGWRSVFILACFGGIPFIATILSMTVLSNDYSYAAMAMTCLFTYVLLVNKKILDQERVHQREVEKQYEDLQHKQRKLEKSASDQEAQLEEIVSLNDLLQENQRVLEERYNIIKSMSSIYFASYYIDLQTDSYVELKSNESIKATIKEIGKAQESLYKACDILVLPEFQEDMREFWDLSTIQKRLKKKSAVSIRYKGVHSGWSSAYLIAGDRDEDGNVKHIFYAARTIHDEKAQEEAQKKKVEEFSDIIANAGLGVWYIFLKDGQMPKMQPNDKMRELLGISLKNFSEEEIYAHWYNRIVPEAIPSVQKSVQEMLDGKFSENTYLWNHPVKGPVYVRCGGTATTQEDGTKVLSGYHAEVTDIVREEQRKKEELEEARKEAESANAAKTTFLFNMSHDIRTPMNAIIGFTELLEKHIDEPEKCEDYLNKIRTSSQFLLSLINNVLEMARIESGKMVLDEMPSAAMNFNDSLFHVFDEQMKNKGIVFTRNIDIQHEYVYCDAVKLREILLNILSNAYKYTPAGGRVRMDLKEVPSLKEGYALYQTTITDNGIGMSKDYLPKLFEEFSREYSVTENKVEGTGLGMPIVKKLVDLMGGAITVQSELGVGTTIVITLYHKIAKETDLNPSQPEGGDYSALENKRILLAEDNDLNAEIATEILEEAGLLVERAADGIICVDMLQKADVNYYDAILMDVQMPNMDGYKATQVIRKMEDTYRKEIPIIAMTANAFDEDKKNALEAGMNAHLAKPIVVDEMMKVLAELLGK